MAEIDEEKFLQRSDVLGAEFVRLFLGDGAAGVPLGPGSGSESWERKAEEGEGQAASESHTHPLGVKMRILAEELHNDMTDGDKENMDKAVVSIAKPIIESGVYQVKQNIFSSLCESVLRQIWPSTGWFQTAVVYRVAAELIQHVRSGASGPTTRELTLLRFAGVYLLSAGFSATLQTMFDQAEHGIVQENVHFPPVDIPDDEQ